MADPSSSDVAMAFGLTLFAGLATTVGATASFFSSLQNKKLLAAGLGLSAGVMIYVSFVEILATKAFAAFATSVGEKYAHLCAASCFFAGCILCAGLDMLVHRMGHHHHHDIDEVMNEHPRPPSLQEVMTGHKVRAGDRPQTTNSEQDMSPKAEREMGPVSEYDCQGSGNRSEDLIAVVAETQDGERQRPASAGSSSALVGAAVRTSSKSGLDASEAKSAEESAVPLTHVHVEAHERASAGHAHGHHSDKELTRMGLLTALAIAIHNFPEGLATFVAALDDPSVGIPIAVAIAIHNIPEGLCVSMPILYASHSRCKAFWWSFLSGVTEPIGALLGYFLLRAIFSDLTFGVLFGLVSGMMVYISFRELIPTARKYDPTDRVVTVSLVIGMAVMAISLILFQVA